MFSGALHLCFQELKKNQREKQEQLRAQERYSMKSSVKLFNPPYDKRIARDVTVETLKDFWAL